MSETESSAADEPLHLSEEGTREKKWAAMSSVIAAVFLTSMKIVVGVLTGSLGILAEAAHSGLDLVAAAVTYVSVRLSSRPADRNHTYGHGKIENLSALFETVLLLVTCVWIIYEAVNRLFFKHVEVEANIWSFLVMSISIAIDYSRSRMLARVAKKYDSQALEADALHFSTDIWSSSVVIGGLALIAISRAMNIPWLAQADSVAAMAVAGIVVYVSVQLGRKAIGDLLDEIPASLADEVEQLARQQPGVIGVRNVRVRRSGPEYFVDMALDINRTAGAAQAHAIAEMVEKAVQQRLAGASVMVHVDPVRSEDEKLEGTLQVLAAGFGLGVHHVQVRKLEGQRILTLHLDVNEPLELQQASDRAAALEQAIYAAIPGIDQVWSHMEPVYRQMNGPTEFSRSTDLAVEALVHDLPRLTGIPCDIHEITLLEQNGRISVSFHCSLKGNPTVLNAHELTERLETELRTRVPHLDQVLIRIEPASAA